VSASSTNARLTEEVRAFYEHEHERRARAGTHGRYWHQYLESVLKKRIPAGQRVLDIGCGTGDILAAVAPSHGVGIDLSQRATDMARTRFPQLEFHQGDGTDPSLLAKIEGTFDVILVVNVITHFVDVQAAFEAFKEKCHPGTRLFVYSYSRLWQPVLAVAEGLGLKGKAPAESWLPPEEVRGMLALADFEVVRRDAHVVCPMPVPLLADFLNRYAGRLPGAAALSLLYGIVARPAPRIAEGAPPAQPSVSVIVPCRNESGHIRPLVQRLPELPAGSEVIFIEGHSTDDTADVIRQVVAENPDRPFRHLTQPGKGKGDAVRHAFSVAQGDVLLILDSDMGVPPEDIPRFVKALATGKGEFINGSRLVYPMEERAMRFLNLVANKMFALLFSWLLGQQVRDTLCGTKALYRRDYTRIAQNRSYFGDFDPFGDFDLLFGAARLDMRIVDIAVRYHERQYGTTNISRFRHGLLLLRMSAFAARRLKFL
jgi:SAM-dependent methyltransferase